TLILGVVLVACGTDGEEDSGEGSDEEEKASADSYDTAETSSEEETAEADSESNDNTTIRIAIKSTIDSLNTFIASATDTEIMMNNVFDGLFDTDENGELVPNLATDYSISDDNLTYTFQLVENATFHNGDPVTAEDVVYSYSKLAGLETGE